MDENAQRLLYAFVQMLAGGLAWSFGARHRDHRVVGLLFTWQLAVDLARRAISPALDAASLPYEGGLLGLYYLDHALELGFRFAIFAAVWAQYGRWKLTPVAATYVGSFLALVLYKLATGASLVPFHQVFGGLVSLGCVGVVVVRVLGPREAMAQPNGAHAILLLLVATDTANAVLHATHAFDAWWDQLRYADTVAASTIVVGYAVAMTREAVRRWRQA